MVCVWDPGLSGVDLLACLLAFDLSQEAAGMAPNTAAKSDPGDRDAIALRRCMRVSCAFLNQARVEQKYRRAKEFEPPPTRGWLNFLELCRDARVSLGHRRRSEKTRSLGDSLRQTLRDNNDVAWLGRGRLVRGRRPLGEARSRLLISPTGNGPPSPGLSQAIP